MNNSRALLPNEFLEENIALMKWFIKHINKPDNGHMRQKSSALVMFWAWTRLAGKSPILNEKSCKTDGFPVARLTFQMVRYRKNLGGIPAEEWVQRHKGNHDFWYRIANQYQPSLPTNIHHHYQPIFVIVDHNRQWWLISNCEPISTIINHH